MKGNLEVSSSQKVQIVIKYKKSKKAGKKKDELAGQEFCKY
jgi:hypothetical protein